ncbi:MAG: helicase-associated domain-containing protein, partial [Treponema sp.]|nr:helicase-associated domain-containing protein [Treponema sp.]
MANPANPLIVQSDRTLLMDVHAEGAEAARSAIMPFAELEKSPEHIHTYQITPLSLWNAASAGLTPEHIKQVLETYSRYPVPQSILDGFADTMARYGKIKLVADISDSAGASAAAPETSAPETIAPETIAVKSAPLDAAAPASLPDTLLLVCESEAIRAELRSAKSLAKYLSPAGEAFRLKLVDRGTVKRELIKLGWPVQDMAPLAAGEPLEIAFRTHTGAGKPFAPRDYQVEAARSVVGDGSPGSGFGVVVLPCGSGKTVVGMTVMTMLQTNTLILTTNVAAVHQ